MEKISESLQIVQDFFAAVNQGDMAAAQSFMANDHKYTGPMFSTDSSEEYFKALGNFGMQFEVETQDLIAADSVVTHISLLKVVAPVQATIPCCEVFNIENGKIARQRFYFDTALFPQANN